MFTIDHNDTGIQYKCRNMLQNAAKWKSFDHKCISSGTAEEFLMEMYCNSVMGENAMTGTPL